MKLSDAASVVAVANPRSLVDVHVCDAETDGVVAEAILTLFELDASIERDACARAVDGLGALLYGDEAAAPAPGARAPRRRSCAVRPEDADRVAVPLRSTRHGREVHGGVDSNHRFGTSRPNFRTL